MPKPPRRPSTRPPQGLPSRDELLAYLREAGEAGKADIAGHFGLKGADRRALRQMLQALEAEGKLGKRGRRGFAEAGVFPPVGVCDVADRDVDGDLWVRLVKGAADLPLVRLAPDKAEVAAGAPGLGDRLLCRFEPGEDGTTEARLIKRLGQSADRVLGVVRKGRRDVRVEPVHRKSKDVFLIPEAEAGDLKDGDLVLVEARPDDRQRYGPKLARVLETVGREDQPRAASLIAVHTHGLPIGHTEAAETEAKSAREPSLKGREDLRQVPLITIDPADARDHDDAVYAEADPDHPGGWIVWVAIADVAAYVRQGTALDKDARDKGNSTYFPDRVEPMLPHALSSDLCSLRENEDRACMAVRMVFDSTGKKTSHRFIRGLMRSAAKLSYEQTQDAADGNPDDKTGPLVEPIIKPLWDAYRTMLTGRLR
ncbi:MAG TPA: RNB domain-containing ribonuclease, partial [Caulobacteraceae bacterium]